mgnify:CR=1 FL=1
MDRIRIKGGRQLKGEIQISGSKNACLPLMVASMLTDKPLTLKNVPRLADISTMIQLLEQHGVEIQAAPGENGHSHGTTLTLRAGTIKSTTAPYDIVRKMRASVLVLGPLVAREGEARVSLPGGCAIGARPVDLHIAGLKAMGAEIDIDGGYMVARAPKGLKGARYTFPKVSVGATENLMMAAALARGTTVLSNAAREPEIEDLARMLSAMGARISGAGTDLITVVGVDSLGGTEHVVMPDRIEAGTFLAAAVATRGDVTVQNANAEHLPIFIDKLREAGATIDVHGTRIRAAAKNGLNAVDLTTRPYPGFATDLQAQMMALLACAKGTSCIKETVFENRFMQASELIRMGADIDLDGGTALVRGVERLSGAPVMASDLRASAALVIAGLTASRGETVISRVYHIDRGYERIEERLAGLGADIERVRE